MCLAQGHNTVMPVLNFKFDLDFKYIKVILESPFEQSLVGPTQRLHVHINLLSVYGDFRAFVSMEIIVSI